MSQSWITGVIKHVQWSATHMNVQPKAGANFSVCGVVTMMDI